MGGLFTCGERTPGTHYNMRLGGSRSQSGRLGCVYFTFVYFVEWLMNFIAVILVWVRLC
jgi:hypothetical protein